MTGEAQAVAVAPAKTEKEIAKEKVKAEKAAKFAAKQAKQKQQGKEKGQKAPSEAKPGPPKETTSLPPFEDKTPPGEKKAIRPFDDPHFQAYNPTAVEAAWYSWWEKQGYFKPESRSDSPVGRDKKFVIPLPPPNVTGALHCGHALANSLQDTLIRWHRMRGYTTLWVPGADHAGISTQSVVEKMLWKREKKTRHDLGREKFTKLVWEWKEDYHQRINNAQRLMGGSMDWSREAFTMDENLTAATVENFVSLHDKGLLYRSSRLVNWCTHLNTALSNLEVDNKEFIGRTMLDVPGYDRKVEFGVLTHFKYPIDGTDAFLEVATTRPETMLGDTGIAVNPNDSRYTHLVGKFARHPFIEDRLLPIIADDYVSIDFGTGAVKLTPAHDNNDWNLGKKHGLKFINILNPNGTLNENAGPKFEGQRRFDARYTVVQELEKVGLFVKKVPNPMKVPVCKMSNDVIEPMMVPQWWVKMPGMARKALDVVEQGKIRIVPDSAKKSYQRWLSDIQDWCISRQLWWGHRIPAYRVIFDGEAGPETEESAWIVGRNQDEAEERAKARFPDKKYVLLQDEDCLDTWFTSGLWPMATLGWPNTQASDLRDFFPMSLLETGWDIMFFWVARMIMLSVELTGEVPFREVYAHSLIRDSEGRKMSKSLGNVIDPLDIINGIELEGLHAKLHLGNLREDEIAKAMKYQKTAFSGGIPECGADALRFTLLSYTTGGGDISFDIRVMHAYRRFVNKIFQASKYVLGKLPQQFVPSSTVDGAKLSIPERWILHRMNEMIKDVNKALEEREFSRCTQLLYKFFYDDLCDVFIENSKSLLSDGSPAEQESVQQTLYRTLDVSLRAIHPIMPFITEELWQRLPRKEGDTTSSIMITPYPEYEAGLGFPSDAEDYDFGLKCAQGLRSLAAEYKIQSGGLAFIKASTATSLDKIRKQLADITTLGGKAISEVKALGAEEAAPAGCAVFVVSADVAVLLQVADRIVDIDAEIKKIGAMIQKNDFAIQKTHELMAREGFAKVSDVVRAAEQKKLEDAEAAKENYERTLEEFNKLKLGA